jgi:predicted transcriptional regulator
MTIATTFRTSKEKMELIDSVASAMGRSRSWLLNKAVDDILEYYQWYVGEVQKGTEAADNGEFASSEEVDVVFRKYGAK